MVLQYNPLPTRPFRATVYLLQTLYHSNWCHNEIWFRLITISPLFMSCKLYKFRQRRKEESSLYVPYLLWIYVKLILYFPNRFNKLLTIKTVSWKATVSFSILNKRQSSFTMIFKQISLVRQHEVLQYDGIKSDE